VPVLDRHEDRLRRASAFADVSLKVGHLWAQPQLRKVALRAVGEHHGLVAADVLLPTHKQRFKVPPCTTLESTIASSPREANVPARRPPNYIRGKKRTDLEAIADPQTIIGNAEIVVAQIGIRIVFDSCHDAPMLREIISQRA
jgi:hypothetical protein